MALFSKKNKKEEKKERKEVQKKESSSKIKSTTAKGTSSDISIENVILKPRITEKTVNGSDLANAYTFEINPLANKKDVANAIEKTYKVTPVKINVCRIPRKAVGVRRGKGFKNGGQKAVVYLKKGDKIDFV
jgi:large subunit ribosomal protein L23